METEQDQRTLLYLLPPPLGFRLGDIKRVSIAATLETHTLELGDIKKKAYKRIREYLVVEGYPSAGDVDLKEANVSDLFCARSSPFCQLSRIRKAGTYN